MLMKIKESTPFNFSRNILSWVFCKNYAQSTTICKKKIQKSGVYFFLCCQFHAPITDVLFTLFICSHRRAWCDRFPEMADWLSQLSSPWVSKKK